MSTEEPAWRADMEGLIDDFLTGITMCGEVAETSERIGELFVAAIGPHIVSAEKRGRQEALGALESAYETHRCANSGSPGLRLPCEHTASMSAFIRYFDPESP